jgi:protein-disulfide isomerase
MTILAGPAIRRLGRDVDRLKTRCAAIQWNPPMAKIKELVLNLATVLVTVAAVLMVGLRVRESFRPGRTSVPEPHTVADWRELAKGGDRIGPADADVTVVAFTDFQCPFCKRAAEDLREVRQQYSARVAIVLRHYPLPSHKFAKAAALAAVCASKQGSLETFHNILFASQPLIGQKAWTAFAAESGVSDMAAFSECLSDPAVAALIERDRAVAGRHGVNGTPTLLINDLEVPGYPGPGRLSAMVRSALDARQKQAIR